MTRALSFVWCEIELENLQLSTLEHPEVDPLDVQDNSCPPFSTESALELIWLPPCHSGYSLHIRYNELIS